VGQGQWARQYLVWEELLDGARRGFWILTQEGWNTHLTEQDGRQLFKKGVKDGVTAWCICILSTAHVRLFNQVLTGA
jgi:hypothetical protein